MDPFGSSTRLATSFHSHIEYLAYQRRGVVQITSIQKFKNLRNFVTVVRQIRIFISKYEKARYLYWNTTTKYFIIVMGLNYISPLEFTLGG